MRLFIAPFECHSHFSCCASAPCLGATTSFDAFRPCYLRAFTDAKDYKADTGDVIKGTKNATDDDYVSVEEFRLFCVYICVYAAMFDACAKIGRPLDLSLL